MQKLRKNDEVIIISGKDKGSSGKILSINFKSNKVTIDKINIIKKHVKPTQNNPDGGIQEREAPIHISKVAFKTKGKDGKATKIGFKIKDGKKVRISRKNGKTL